MSDKRYEVALYIGPCSEEDAVALSEAILALEEARAVHAGAVSVSPEVTTVQCFDFTPPSYREPVFSEEQFNDHRQLWDDARTDKEDDNE